MNQLNMFTKAFCVISGTASIFCIVEYCNDYFCLMSLFPKISEQTAVVITAIVVTALISSLIAHLTIISIYKNASVQTSHNSKVKQTEKAGVIKEEIKKDNDELSYLNKPLSTPMLKEGLYFLFELLCNHSQAPIGKVKIILTDSFSHLPGFRTLNYIFMVAITRVTRKLIEEGVIVELVVSDYFFGYASELRRHNERIVKISRISDEVAAKYKSGYLVSLTSGAEFLIGDFLYIDSNYDSCLIANNETHQSRSIISSWQQRYDYAKRQGARVFLHVKKRNHYIERLNAVSLALFGHNQPHAQDAPKVV